MTIRIALAIDVEPVPRVMTTACESDWDGLRASVRLVRSLRDRLSRTQPAVPAFTWLVRMDQQIRGVYGNCGYIAERFASQLDELESEGDDIGLHTHLFRRLGREGEWVTDYESVEWMQRCVHEAARAFQDSRSRAPRYHSFGDRYFSAAAVALLDELGFAVDMSVEPGFFSVDRIQPGETLLGRMPDTSRAPRSMWRPAHDDCMKDDRAGGRNLRLLPVTTYRFPLWLEPGRRIEHVVRAVRGNPPGEDERRQRHARLGASQRGYVFRQGVRSAIAADQLTTVHLVLRANQAMDTAAFDRIVNNLEWLARGGLGSDVAFVSTSALLAMADRGDGAAV